ncbi:HEAT repeat domain-containing protein [Oscillatoria sp. FACHB-1407]|uniref:phycobilisome degradation protein NblB n=1 Tax=Oscillatoria sp. FACHB-1407 TaxID=2692847 RepID=UPI0016893F79|nr:HEAT repeat domain-containing protein [Oscillatoria sp. FACHB-1407]MBD2460700.1 HEAT repeat domain-containing protein [Oscillatoria sp. FACHB-1407]
MTVTPESVQQLLTSDDYGQRLTAINQLRQLEPTIAFDMIQTAVNDPNARVRYAAISQLATLGQQDLHKSLTILRDRLLNDKEVDVQAAAADSIGALQLKEAYEDLQTIYQSSSEWLLQFSIIAALGELGDPRSFELLQSALESNNELIRTAAVGSLGELGDSRALPLLIPYASDQDSQIRYRVAQALGRLNHPQALAVLEVLANDEVETVAQEAKVHLQAS